jgi:hypothetical protein
MACIFYGVDNDGIRLAMYGWRNGVLGRHDIGRENSFARLLE